jgi:hypothetical protein
MARISQGNALTSALLQPDWTFNNNGYGLLTVKARWAIDEASAFSDANIGISATFTEVSGETLKCTKSTYAFQKNALVFVDQEYVGIASGLSGTTRPDVTASNGLTSEHITTHSNFFTASTGIAGGTPFTASSILGPNNSTLYKGLNGSHFQDPNGGKFVGFLDPAYPLYYGKNQYLAPVTSFSGVIYTTDSNVLTNLKGDLGKTSGTNQFSSTTLLPSVFGTTFTTGSPSRNQLLLSQVNMESYALNSSGVPYMMKINYEIRYNVDGYPSAVYGAA